MSSTGNALGIAIILLALYIWAKYGIQSWSTTLVGLVLFVFAVFWPDGR